MKLNLEKRKYCTESKKNLLILKHDRYLARAHTLISFSVGLVISLLLFFVAGLLEDYFVIEKKTIFISLLLFAIISSIAVTTYLNWKATRIQAIDNLIDLCESKKSNVNRA